jgi:hypothetical protein
MNAISFNDMQPPGFQHLSARGCRQTRCRSFASLTHGYASERLKPQKKFSPDYRRSFASLIQGFANSCPPRNWHLQASSCCHAVNESMAQSTGKCVGNICWFRESGQSKFRADHPLDLVFACTTAACNGFFDARSLVRSHWNASASGTGQNDTASMGHEHSRAG